MLFCLEAERTWGGTGLSLGLRVANDCAGQFHRALVELAARFLVRACEAQFAQRIDDADSFGGRDGLRKVDWKSTRLELQSLMRISYAVFCLKKKTTHIIYNSMSKIILTITHIHRITTMRYEKTTNNTRD